MTAVSRSNHQSLRAALLWAGPDAAAAVRRPPRSTASRASAANARDRRSREDTPYRGRRRASERGCGRAMVRRRTGRVTGVEPTLVALGAALEPRRSRSRARTRRRRAHVRDVARATSTRTRAAGRATPPTARRLDPCTRPVDVGGEDPAPARRPRLTDFVREFPLDWHGRTYRFDFAFERRTILETNGAWHDDARLRATTRSGASPAAGYRLVFATWDKVTRRPRRCCRARRDAGGLRGRCRRSGRGPASRSR